MKASKLALKAVQNTFEKEMASPTLRGFDEIDVTCNEPSIKPRIRVFVRMKSIRRWTVQSKDSSIKGNTI